MVSSSASPLAAALVSPEAASAVASAFVSPLAADVGAAVVALFGATHAVVSAVMAANDSASFLMCLINTESSL